MDLSDYEIDCCDALGSERDYVQVALDGTETRVFPSEDNACVAAQQSEPGCGSPIDAAFRANDRYDSHAARANIAREGKARGVLMGARHKARRWRRGATQIDIHPFRKQR